MMESVQAVLVPARLFVRWDLSRSLIGQCIPYHGGLRATSSSIRPYALGTSIMIFAGLFLTMGMRVLVI